MTELNELLERIRKRKVILGMLVEAGDTRRAARVSKKLDELYAELGATYNTIALSKSYVDPCDDDHYIKELETVGYIIGIKL